MFLRVRRGRSNYAFRSNASVRAGPSRPLGALAASRCTAGRHGDRCHRGRRSSRRWRCPRPCSRTPLQRVVHFLTYGPPRGGPAARRRGTTARPPRSVHSLYCWRSRSARCFWSPEPRSRRGRAAEWALPRRGLRRVVSCDSPRFARRFSALHRPGHGFLRGMGDLRTALDDPGRVAHAVTPVLDVPVSSTGFSAGARRLGLGDV